MENASVFHVIPNVNRDGTVSGYLVLITPFVGFRKIDPPLIYKNQEDLIEMLLTLNVEPEVIEAMKAELAERNPCSIRGVMMTDEQEAGLWQ
jgi:hypothetical protein